MHGYVSMLILLILYTLHELKCHKKIPIQTNLEIMLQKIELFIEILQITMINMKISS